MEREYPLHADTGRNFPYREGAVNALTLLGDNIALEYLYALFFAFLNSNMNPDVIAGFKIRQFFFKIFAFNCL